MCKDCKHEDHEPGRCKFDNCGEAEVSHLSSARKLAYWLRVEHSSLMREGYDMGHVVPKRNTNDG